MAYLERLRAVAGPSAEVERQYDVNGPLRPQHEREGGVERESCVHHVDVLDVRGVHLEVAVELVALADPLLDGGEGGHGVALLEGQAAHEVVDDGGTAGSRAQQFELLTVEKDLFIYFIFIYLFIYLFILFILFIFIFIFILFLLF